jgi:uncharacterized damage-inducible protein DinB
MIAEYPWFERLFTFDLPVWMYPNVVERLRGTPARLEELVKSLDTRVLTRRDGEDWSIQENAGHLWDLESLWSGRLDDFLNGQEMLRAADLNNRKTYDANHNNNVIGAILDAFRRERLELVRRLDDLTEAQVQQTALHPRLVQPMRVLDHAFFVAEHDDHHLAQITRLKCKFSL